MDEEIRKVKKHVDKSFKSLIKKDIKHDRVIAKAHKVLQAKKHTVKKQHSRGR